MIAWITIAPCTQHAGVYGDYARLQLLAHANGERYSRTSSIG